MTADYDRELVARWLSDECDIVQIDFMSFSDDGVDVDGRIMASYEVWVMEPVPDDWDDD